MKICPQCSKKYTDETLNFCLDDGCALVIQHSTESPPPTVIMPAPRTSATRNQQQTAFQSPEVPTQPRFEMPARKKSRAWPWVLGILAGVGIFCGGGFIAIVALLPSDGNSSNTSNERRIDNTVKIKDDIPDKTAKVEKPVTWKINEDEYISVKKEDGSLVLTSKKGFYYVILGKMLETRNATTILTVKNTTGEKAASGFGLVIHSDPDEVLKKDYAFLIRSDDKTYRVVQHTKKKERDLVKWTDSRAIRGGTSENELEVRVDGNDMNFYINGEFIRKIKDYTNYKDGVAGVYTSDDVPIAFSKIELKK